MTRREPVERIIVLCIRIYILYIHTYKPRPGSQAQANAQLHVTYDSLTGIVFEFLASVVWLVFGKCTYMYISFVCESCCISSLLQLFSLDRSWAFIPNSSSSSNTVLRWRFVSYRYCSTYDEGVEKRDSVGGIQIDYRSTTVCTSSY